MINGKKVVATIEARMTSTRLPGKVMMLLAGKPVTQHMIERHRRSKYTDEVVVATTTNATDDPIVKLCEQMGYPYFRGSEDDVLGRVAAAGEKHGAEILVQGMADSPMVDHRLLDKGLELLVAGGYDFMGNEFEETYPVGFDVHLYSFPTFKYAADIDTEPLQREHAGYSIQSQPDKYKIGNFKAEGEMVWPKLRLTLDTREDYKLINAVYDALYTKNPDFSAEDVVAFLKTRPDLVAINAEVKQKNPAVE
jgi:spore coat polysaccharide biosynthesis protein SpsF